MHRVDDGASSNPESGAEATMREVTDNASFDTTASCPTDQCTFSRPSRASSPTAIKPSTSVRPWAKSSSCRPPTQSSSRSEAHPEWRRHFRCPDEGDPRRSTGPVFLRPPSPQAALVCDQDNPIEHLVLSAKMTSRSQRERFALSPETDTMVILPMMVCGRHAGIKRLICGSAPGVRNGPRRLPLSLRCA